MSVISDIKGLITIEEALSHFGIAVPPKGRDPVMILCPWHDDHRPSCAVYRKQGRAWCFSCNKGGDILDVTALFIKRDNREAIRYWAECLGLGISHRPSPEETARLDEGRRRRRLKEWARRESLKAEQSIPRPSDPDLLPLWDTVYGAKDAIDEHYREAEDSEAVSEYIHALWKWRREAIGFLKITGATAGFFPPEAALLPALMFLYPSRNLRPLQEEKWAQSYPLCGP